jgi:hypothetical protein
MTSRKIVTIGDNFWNIRGDLRIAGLVNIKTQMSLAKRANGKFLLLDACELDDEQRAFIDGKTNGGEAIEAVLHLHPFHTLSVKSLHAIYPKAKLYGTTRHKSHALDLPWQPELTNQPTCHGLFADDFDFSVPRGVDFIPENQSLHFSSVLAFHRASRTLHVDDTLCYVRLPKLLRSFKEDMLGFHPSLSKVLEPRPGAASDFRAWADELIAHSRDLENLCTAHLHVLSSRETNGPSIADRIANAVRDLDGKLAAHERRFG